MSSSVASEKLDDKAKAHDETPGTAETSSWAEESSPTSIEASQPASAKTDQPDSTPNAAAKPTSTDVDKINNAPNEVQQTLPSPDTNQINSVSDGLQQSLPPAKLDQNNNVSDEAQPKLPIGKTVQDDGAPAIMGGSGQVIDSSHDVDVKLSDVQADPNDPLYSIKSFQELGLDELILKGIYQMRFTKPSKIQEKALPLLLSNPPVNLIGQSQSGTGKTAAYVLNILARVDLKDPEMRGVPQALCLAPTRELARQIIGVIQMMGSFVENLNVLAAIPMEITNRKEKLHGQIVVGTPGTVLDLIRKRLLQANQIKVLVLDEADNMLDLQGMGDQCIRVKKLLPQTVQTVLFSATFPEKVVKYAANFAPNSNQITLRHEELTVKGIKQVCLDCRDEEHKFEVLVNLYGLMTIGSSIIFVNSRETADRIEKRMNREGHKVAQLTGKFAGSDRDDIIDSFRDGRAKVLIATNVLARGIDVQTVSLVVNYDVPYTVDHRPDPETYLHRIGRTGRFGRVGVSISLVHNPKSWHALKEIGDFFGVEPILLDTTDWDQVEVVVKRVIKSSRAGADFNMNEDE